MADTANKLTDEEKLQVCTWLAQFVSVDDVCTKATATFKKSLTRTAVTHYLHSPKWQPLLQRCRTEWAQQVGAVPIAHQRARLERLERLWERAEQDPAALPWRKRTELLTILKAAREEMQQHQPVIQQLFLTNITNATDDELWQRKEALLQRFEEGFPHGTRWREKRVEAGTGSGPSSGVGAESQPPAPHGSQ